jgi:hypothetical protein
MADRKTTSESGLTAAERKAVKQAAAEGRRTKAGKNTEQDVLDAITAMDGSDREIAEGLHQLVRRVTPDLVPRTWYGFPAYAKDGKAVLFCSSRASSRRDTGISDFKRMLSWMTAPCGRPPSDSDGGQGGQGFREAGV